MATKEIRGKEFRAAMTAKDIRPADLVRYLASIGISVTSQTVNNWFARGVATDKAGVVADYLDVDVELISDVFPGRERLDQLVEQTRAAYGSEPLPSRRVIQLPEVEIKVSMGPGGEINLSDEIVAHYPAERAVLERNGIDPENCVLIRGYGDSMVTTIHDRDLVIVNKSVKGPPNGRVYAIETDNGIRFKRVSLRLDKSVEVSSDNPDKQRYPTEVYEPAVAESILKIYGVAEMNYLPLIR